jgi:hypothetical protein
MTTLLLSPLEARVLGKHTVVFAWGQQLLRIIHYSKQTAV